jgi:hypothetical protein
MNRQSKEKPSTGQTPQTKKGEVLRVFLVIAVIAAVVVGGAFFFKKRQNGTDGRRGNPPPAEPASVEAPRDVFQVLIGEWLRPDGGYLIEINKILANGRLDARYLNPRLINVSVAEAAQRTDGLRVFIELQDVGYPGSTYTLLYDPQRDILSGTYFQAALGQSFDVMFVRMK